MLRNSYNLIEANVFSITYYEYYVLMQLFKDALWLQWDKSISIYIFYEV